MRLRHSNVRRALAAAWWTALAVAATAGALRAQGGLATEGVLFLLVPVGARTAGSGQAAVTSEAGSESLWSNPAGIARMTRPEMALLYSKTFVENGMALAVVYPAGRAGVLGFGVQLYDDGGPQEHTTDPSGAIGELVPSSRVYVAAYAATLGPFLRAGVTFKVVQQLLACTGPCSDVSTFNRKTYGLDAGLQYLTHRADSLTFGFALRNFGLKMQVNDNAQADPPPTRLNLGVGARVPAMARALPGAELRWAVEMVNRTSLNDPSVHVGAELGLQRQLYLRAGYVSGTGDASGGSIGLGFVRGKLALDFARVFGGASSDLGLPPTFLTLRVSW